MLDHVGFAVSDYARSKGFYERALAPLGLTVLLEPVGEAAGFGRDGKPFFWIESRGQTVVGRLHVAFAVDDRETVDAFHVAALEAGGTDNGRRGCARSITPTTTVHTSSTRTATTSRRSATDPCSARSCRAPPIQDPASARGRKQAVAFR